MTTTLSFVPCAELPITGNATIRSGTAPMSNFTVPKASGENRPNPSSRNKTKKAKNSESKGFPPFGNFGQNPYNGNPYDQNHIIKIPTAKAHTIKAPIKAVPTALPSAEYAPSAVTLLRRSITPVPTADTSSRRYIPTNTETTLRNLIPSDRAPLTGITALILWGEWSLKPTSTVKRLRR